MAETTEDGREPQASEDEREQRATGDEQEAQASEQERKPEASEEERKPEGGEEERKPEGGEEDGNAEADQESKAPDLPDPEEKSAEDLLGQQVVDPHGVTIGKIEALYIHGQEDRASWALVKTGLIGSSSSFVPLHDAQQDGRRLRVVYEKEWVKAAPEIEPEGNELSDDDADALHGHYGMERVQGLTTEGSDDIELSREARDANPPTMDEPPWAIEKYPLPDMERPEGKEPGREGSSDERSQREGSSDEDSEEGDSG